MSKKTKIIATRSVFFFDNCFLLLLIWQGLEKLFYGKVMSSSFDTFVAVTMLPVLWNMAEYLTLGVKIEYKESFRLLVSGELLPRSGQDQQHRAAFCHAQDRTSEAG